MLQSFKTVSGPHCTSMEPFPGPCSGSTGTASIEGCLMEAEWSWPRYDVFKRQGVRPIGDRGRGPRAPLFVGISGSGCGRRPTLDIDAAVLACWDERHVCYVAIFPLSRSVLVIEYESQTRCVGSKWRRRPAGVPGAPGRASAVVARVCFSKCFAPWSKEKRQSCNTGSWRCADQGGTSHTW